MCKNDACQKYIAKVKSINADNCPFSHRGIDMVVKKADFELDRIDKAWQEGGGSSDWRVPGADGRVQERRLQAVRQQSWRQVADAGDVPARRREPQQGCPRGHVQERRLPEVHRQGQVDQARTTVRSVTAIDMVVKKADFELDRIDKACGKKEVAAPTGACQELTDVFKSDDYKQCVNSLGGKWQTPGDVPARRREPQQGCPRGHVQERRLPEVHRQGQVDQRGQTVRSVTAVSTWL
ncbi:hypothetical protein PINS_up007521 [Pythium insidiosum]|nr:hypothetical protein PINS_up007521 [Pythium insidiosum]